MASAIASEDGIIRGPKKNLHLLNESFGRVLLRKLISCGESVAQVYPELGPLTVTARELSRRAASVSLELAERGLGVGDVMVVACGIVPQFTPLMIGAAARGVTVSPINPGFDTNDLRALVSGTLQPRLAVAEAAAAANIRAACPEVDVIDMADVESWMERSDVPLDGSGDVVLEKVAAADGQDWIDNIVVIMCSSGTTGLPKGVMMTNSTVTYQTAALSQPELKLEAHEVSLQYTPLFWVSGLFAQFFSIYNGGRIVVLPRFEEISMIKAVQEYKVEFMMLAPNTAMALSKSSAVRAAGGLSSLCLLIVAGATMEAQAQRLVEQALSVRINQWFVMTEVLLVIASESNEDTPSGSVGRVQSNVEAKVVDPETGKVLGPNSEGELCFKAPTVTKGYYRRSEATAQAFDADGWFHSGDIGYYDDKGFFYITNRLKDLIKFRGNHVAPSELEGILLTHPEVKDASVVGVPHELDQEHPRAYVVRQPGAKVTEAELQQLIDGVVADFKRLRGGIRFVDQLPRTATGKVSRRDLRDLAKSEVAAVA